MLIYTAERHIPHSFTSLSFGRCGTGGPERAVTGHWIDTQTPPGGAYTPIRLVVETDTS